MAGGFSVKMMVYPYYMSNEIKGERK